MHKMGERKPVNGVKELQYVNPLTLEAKMFANSLRKYSPEFNLIDNNLCSALEEVLTAIDRFLDQNPKAICETSNTKIAEIPQRFQFDMIYCCKLCKEEYRNPKTATQHLCKHLQRSVTPRDNNQKPTVVNSQNNNVITNGIQVNNNIKSTNEIQVNNNIKSTNGIQMNNQMNNQVKPTKATKTRREPKSKTVVILPKKIKSLFQRDLKQFISTSVVTGEKLKKLPEYDFIVNDLNSIIKPCFPNTVVKTYFFGSRVYGLGQTYSDLDIFIDIGGKFNNFENRATPETLNNFHIVSKALKKSKVFRLLESVEKARVPVLKVNHKAHNIDCDLSFSNGFGYSKTALIKYLLELQPIAKYMCIFLKKWLEVSRLQNFSSYSFILLLIVFFQLRLILPSIESLQCGLSETTKVGPWITVFAEKTLSQLKIKKIDETVLNCKKFMKEFFTMYAEFDFKNHLLCPYYGKIIDKKCLNSIMPQRYIDYVRMSGEDCSLSLSFMTIQDPIQMNHNLTKGMSLKNVTLFQDYFRLSAELLNDI